MIEKFQKLPIIVEAIKFNGKNDEEIHEFSDGTAHKHISRFDKVSMVISTVEGNCRMHVGDYIVKGEGIGDFYPVRAKTMPKIYKKVT